MKLATIESENNSRDGQLVVISSNSSKAAIVKDLYLQKALEDWGDVQNNLNSIYKNLNEDNFKDAVDVNNLKFKAPLPRAYSFLDGSAFIQHVILVRKARGAEPPEGLFEIPLMYQGISSNLLGPSDDICFDNPDYGLDFEGEYAVILGDTPLGTKAEDAAQYVKLIVMMNDVSLRGLIPRELKTGFGFLHGKPSSAFAPFAVTPEELGEYWKDGRVCLPLESTLNGELYGKPNGKEMHFSFYQLIEHASKTRALHAGTILGSGTISNKDESVGSSCLAEKRMLEKINTGEISTAFMKPGDTIEMDVKIAGKSVFGKISQKVNNA